MGIFRYTSDFCGCNKPYITKIKLDENVDVEKGDILYFKAENGTVTKEKLSTAVIAGVCAEDYKAESSELVPSYGNGVVSVIVSPGALYRVPAYILCDCVGGERRAVATNIEEAEYKKTEGYIGSKLVLIEKAENSSNPNKIGTVFEVISIVEAGGHSALATDKEVCSCIGDKYIFIPNYGFELFGIDDNGTFSPVFDESGALTVIDADATGYTVMLKNVKTAQ